MKQLRTWINAGLAGMMAVSAAAQGQTFDSLAKGNHQAQREARFTEIRSRLTTRLDFSGLEQIKLLSQSGDQSEDPSSAFFFKEILSGPSGAMLREVKYGTPVALNPTMTLSDLELEQRRKDMHVCISALNKDGIGKDGRSAIDKILSSVMFGLVDAKKEKNRTSNIIGGEELAAVQAIRAHMARGPLNKNGKSVSDILGTAQDLNLHAGRIKEINMTNGQDLSKSSDALDYDQRIALSLSMLVSMRTRQDEAFVRLQRCLVDYLGEQKKVFGQRLTDIEKSVGRGAGKPSAVLFTEQNLDSVNANVVTLPNVSEGQKPAYTLKFFMEGRPGFSALGPEKEFLRSRLARIDYNMGFLQGRLIGATKANVTLSQLSREQMDFLIDMFLQLNREDLPVAEACEEMKMNAADSQNASAINSAVYYNQINRDLTALNQHLIEEAAKLKSKQEDLRAIQQLR